MLSTRQKKKIRFIVVSSAALVVLALSAWVALRMSRGRSARFVRYPEFGIIMPENYSIHGIDVSKYQERVSWEEVQAMQVKQIKLGFAFIKATEGIGNTDPQFKRNWKSAKQAGMIRGAYHFFIGSKDGRMQAENFIKQVELEPGDLPPVLDAEQLNGSNPQEFREELKQWLDIVFQYYHIKPIIYTNVDFYNKVMGDTFKDYPLWVAHYYETGQPRISRDWLFWQHSDEGRVNGIFSKVDFNVFNGDSTEFRELLVPAEDSGN